jgi:2-polyprenyl-6-methoxyphenol hydroxylase-like FAD-dependent oxidoreductase
MKENSLRVLARLGIFERVASSGVRLLRGEVRDERRRLLLNRGMESEVVYTVKRGELHRALLDAAVQSGAIIETSSRVAGATANGELVLESGVRVNADVVIGADGFHSKVRDSLGMAKSATLLSDGTTRLLIKRSPAEADGVSVEHWGGRHRIGVVPCTATETYVFLASPENDRRGVQVPLDKEYWISRFPHLRHVIERVGPDGAVHHAHPYVVPNTWVRGRTAIVGDAAHAQPPNLGQGAGLAIANAMHLADALSATRDVPAALENWERSARPLADEVQSWSYRYSVISAAWPFLYDARSALVWGIAHWRPTGSRWGYLWRGGLTPPSERPDHLLAV